MYICKYIGNNVLPIYKSYSLKFYQLLLPPNPNK